MANYAHQSRSITAVPAVTLLVLSITVSFMVRGHQAARAGSSWEEQDQLQAKLDLLQVQMTQENLDVAARGLCQTIVTPLGYPCTEYTVQTEDGYLLGVQNIPYGLNGPDTKPCKPVLLQHGIFGGGDNWVLDLPSQSLGFILADAGYDVWIGNIRGIGWSHGHISLAPTDKAFWSWSWDALAAFDLPAMLDFVYRSTGSKVIYIGHSQGTSIYLGGLSGTPQASAMAAQLAGAVLICPIAYMDQLSSNFVIVASKLYFDEIWKAFGVAVFDLHNALGQKLIAQVCSISSINCASLFAAVTGNNCCVNGSRVPYYTNFFPQPTSSQNMEHFAQMVRSGKFMKYDYGSKAANLAHYLQTTPPIYNITSLPTSVPILIVQGGKDDLADPANVKALVANLSAQVKKVILIPNYGHADFMVSPTANEDVYGQITSFLQTLT